MAENESIEEYITRFNKMTQMLELAESQKVALFIANLKGILKEHVIISNPLTLVRAFECARIKASAAQHNKESIEMQVKKLVNLHEETMKEQNKEIKEIKTIK